MITNKIELLNSNSVITLAHANTSSIANLNINNTGGTVLQDVVSKLNEKYDAVMTLQPTSPFRTIDDINNSIELFENDKEADCLVSVVKVPHNYSPEKLMDYDGKYLHGNCNVNRRQDVQTLYARNGAAISITKTKRLGEYIFGGNILPYFMNKLNSIDIDDMEDWNIAEGLF